MLTFGRSNAAQTNPPGSPRVPQGPASAAREEQLAALRISKDSLSYPEKIIPALLRASSQFTPTPDYYRPCNPPHKLSTLSVLYSIGAEHLLAVRDPAIDPVLCRWLDKHVALAKQCPTEPQQVESLMTSIRSTFNRSPHRLLHPIATTRYRNMTNKDDETPRLMGEFITNRIGDCRHIAMLLQLGLQETGLTSAMLIGDLEERVGPSPGQPLFREFHALNMVVVDQKYRLIDPAHRINQSLGWVGHSPITAAHIVDRFMRQTLITDPTTSWAGETFRFHFKVVATSLAGLPALSDNDAQSILRGIKRAKLT